MVADRLYFMLTSAMVSWIGGSLVATESYHLD